MKFTTLQDAEKVFNPYLPFSEVDKAKHINYWAEYKNKPKMGEWLLFKHISTEGGTTTISRPILALIIGHTIWDQALVLEYVTQWRAWQHNTEVLNTNVDAYYSISYNDKAVQHIQFWTDDIIVMGHWKEKPSFRELRQSFREYK